MITDHFFPRSRTFWLYHGSAMVLGEAVTLSMVLKTGVMVAWQIALSFAWILFFTFAVLTFRCLYKRNSGASLLMGRLIVAAIVYSVVAGFLIAYALQWSVGPFFWSEIEAKYPGKLSEVLHSRFAEDFISSQLIVAVWAFIYVSVTSMRRVRLAEVSNLRLENALKDAQLSSLANQLNPHFLFNALNNIRFMIYEDARNADKMITALSEILRYSLDSSRHEKIGLGQELEIIGKYLALVATQLENRLTFELDVAPGLQALLVPPMVLQMLVENAVKHGLDPLPQGGVLQLEASSAKGQLRIAVRNDTQSQPSPADGMGIGLRNIAQRLHLLYGDGARLDVAREAARFTATLTLPMESA